MNCSACLFVCNQKYDEREIQEHFREFYVDAIEEFQKAGKIVQFKVRELAKEYVCNTGMAACFCLCIVSLCTHTYYVCV